MTNHDDPRVAAGDDIPALQVATAYARAGYRCVPIPFRQKGPRLRDWQELRLTEADLPRYFNGSPMNVGVLLGEAGGGRVDVDLDCAEAVELADVYLPPTPATFGRASRERSHRVYDTGGSVRTFRERSADGSTIIELRGDGAQTVFPGSVHPSGEAVAWSDGSRPDEPPVPATADAAELADAVRRIAAEVRRRRGEAEPANGDARRGTDGQAAADAAGGPQAGREALLSAGRAYAARRGNVGEGGRDDAAFNIAGHLCAFIVEGTGEALSEADVLALVRGWNLLNTPPLPEADVARAVGSAYTGNGTPRDPKVVRLRGDKRADDFIGSAWDHAKRTGRRTSRNGHAGDSARSARADEANGGGDGWPEPTPLHVRPDPPTVNLPELFPPGLEPIRDFIAAVANAR